MTLGNADLLNCPKTAFLCSRKVSAGAILKCYDWAIKQRDNYRCIVSGFHSKLEKDVLHFLLKGEQPIIIVLARVMYKKPDKRLQERLDKGNLLIISPFEDTVIKVTSATCQIRNKYIMEIADDIVIGYANPNGNLVNLLQSINKPVKYLS